MQLLKGKVTNPHTAISKPAHYPVISISAQIIMSCICPNISCHNNQEALYDWVKFKLPTTQHQKFCSEVRTAFAKFFPVHSSIPLPADVCRIYKEVRQWSIQRVNAVLTGYGGTWLRSSELYLPNNDQV